MADWRVQLEQIKTAVVIGAGKSGLAAARFLAGCGIRVTVSERRTAAECVDLVAAVPEAILWEWGGHQTDTLLKSDLIVLSPGVPPFPALLQARSQGIPIIGEIELAAAFVQAPILAVTGTNGKSTVTALLGQMAAQTGRAVFVGGNLGTPLIDAVGTPAAQADGLVVIELSSFQLETTEQFHPRAAALLNLTVDHMDRYANLTAYGNAKLRIAEQMTDADNLIIHYRADFFIEGAKNNFAQIPRLLYGAAHSSVEQAAWIENDQFVIRIGSTEERYPKNAAHIIGRHNDENVLAALLMARSSGLITRDQALAGLQAFFPLPHRMELVATHDGIRFFDDSKATNVDSVVAGIDGFPWPFVLIAGGRDKGGSYLPLAEALKRSPCIGAILIGEAREKIAAALTGIPSIGAAASMADAVADAVALVQKWRSGQECAIVLSPACSSYDMFKNYEQRGQVFRQSIEELPWKLSQT